MLVDTLHQMLLCWRCYMNTRISMQSTYWGIILFDLRRTFKFTCNYAEQSSTDLGYCVYSSFPSQFLNLFFFRIHNCIAQRINSLQLFDLQCGNNDIMLIQVYIFLFVLFVNCWGHSRGLTLEIDEIGLRWSNILHWNIISTKHIYAVVFYFLNLINTTLTRLLNSLFFEPTNGQQAISGC